MGGVYIAITKTGDKRSGGKKTIKQKSSGMGMCFQEATKRLVNIQVHACGLTSLEIS